MDDDLAYSLLTYNVCHSDMLVALHPLENSDSNSSATVANPDSSKLLIARPRFNFFHPVSQRILAHLRDSESLEAVSYPAESDPNVICPIGFLIHGGIHFDDWSAFHIKGGQSGIPSESAQVQGSGTRPVVFAVYFPLVALLVPKWLGIIANKPRFAGPGCRKLLYLISGEGLPRDPMADPQHNSTESTARLIAFFVETFFDDIQTVQVHSDTPGMFRYDENIRFVNEQLRPAIESRRTELAQRFGADWRHRFRVIMTLTAGAPARILSIHNSLRRFQPHTLHVWQLKSFWHEYPNVKYLKDSDVEFQRFRSTELSPPIPRQQVTDPLMLDLVRHMNEHRLAFESAVEQRAHELEQFWLRKTRQPVLAVLVTQKDGQPPVFWRGMNVEVSMPTGSLCSERAAIAAALAADPSLSRRHFKLIAVLSHSLQSPSTAVLAAASSSILHHPSQSTPQNTPVVGLTPSSSSTASSTLSNAHALLASQMSDLLTISPNLRLSSLQPSMSSVSSSFGSVVPAAFSGLLSPALTCMGASSLPLVPQHSWSKTVSHLSTAISSPSSVSNLSADSNEAKSNAAAVAEFTTSSTSCGCDCSSSSQLLSAAVSGASVMQRTQDSNLTVPSPLQVPYEQKTPSVGGFSTSSSASQAPLTPLAPFALAGPLPPSFQPLSNGSTGAYTPGGPVLEFLASSSSVSPSSSSSSSGSSSASSGNARPRSDSAAIGPSIIQLVRQSSTSTGSHSVCSSTPSTPGKDTQQMQQQQAQRRNGPVLPRPISTFRTLAVAKDLNPLAPCGSCKEWLKKIAEVNPDFTVVTFSNATLDAIYVDPVINWA